MEFFAMKETLRDLLLKVMAITAVSCLVTLMAVFMGSRRAGGGDLEGLILLQAMLAPPALLIVMTIVYRFVAADGWTLGLRAIWRALPQWLVFMFLLLNSLFLFGEIAFVVVMQATDNMVRWQDHVPLVAMLLCSSAYLALYARKHSYPGSQPAMSGRWMDR